MKAATEVVEHRVVLLGISIHAAREGGDKDVRYKDRDMPISIHAAREGGDDFPRICGGDPDISIHAAREGGDHVRPIRRRSSEPFQSTPPVKAATTSTGDYTCGSAISIHAAREGGDAGHDCTI